MQDKCLNGDANACPNIATYTSVIHVVAMCRDQESAREAENLLQQMKEIEKSGGLQVNTIAYSSVIDAIVKSNVDDGHKRALNLLREMQTRAKDGKAFCAPNTITYNSVISAFTNKGEVGGARLLFNEMLRESSRGNEQIVPDTITYASLLHGYAKNKNPHSSRMALELLHMLEDKYTEGNKKLKPNNFVYTSAIASLANSSNPDAPLQAEGMLKRLQKEYEDGNTDVQPNSHMLGAVLRVWFASKEAQAPERASALLSWAEEKYNAGNNLALKSHRILYNQLLLIWAYSRRADALLHMENIINTMSNLGTGLQPDSDSYYHYMIAVKHSNPKHGLKQQIQIFRFLVQAHKKGSKLLKPSTKAANLVLETCGNTSFLDEDVLVDAKALVKETGKLILESEYNVWEPNSMTYTHFFDACRNVNFESSTLLKAIYQKCIHKGLTNGDIQKSYYLCLNK